MAFINVEECINKLLAQPLKLPATVATDLLEARDRVLAEDVVSDIDVPPADNSAMDGYAIRASDLDSTNSLPIDQRIQAGDEPKTLIRNTAARIFTGAEIPSGADTVVMQENCIVDSNLVSFNETILAGSNIRRQGQDIASGSVVVKKGQRLRAQELGLLASIGLTKANTYQPLKIAIVNTGNELIEPGQALKKGQIYNSNRFLLDGILNGWGFDVTHCEIVADNFSSTKEALKKISQSNDIVITTGGVSVGEEDHIKPAVEALGVIDLWKVAIKPGKPFAFGHIQDTPFIGLPGNPASVFATLLILARPFLLKQQGLNADNWQTNILNSVANFDKKISNREDYLRARYSDGKVDIYPNQSSGVLSSASWGNCFVKQSVGETIHQNQNASILLYSDLLK